MTQRRKDLLESLVTLAVPARQLEPALASFHWDSEEELVILDRRTASNILERALAGDVRFQDLEDWANGIEGRDDVGREHGYEELLNELIFEFANPEIEGPVNEERVTTWLERIGKS